MGFQSQPWRNRHALAFGGTDEYAGRATGLAAFPQSFTMAGWFKPDGTAAVEYLFEVSNGTTANQVRAFRRGDLVYPILDVRFNGQVIQSAIAPATSITAGVWNHVAVTRDSSNVIRCYLNGVICPATPTNATDVGSTKATIAASAGGAGAHPYGTVVFAGRVSSFMIFSGIIDVDALYGCPGKSWLNHPSLYLALNPSHAKDSATGLIHDWTPTGQDYTPANMEAADIVADAP